MDIEAKVGAQTLSDGARFVLRGDKTGALVTTDGHARYAEAVLRGNVYVGQTASTGVAPGTAVGTTAAFALANPPNSGYNLILLETSVGYHSGTLGAGVIQYCINTGQTAASATSGTAIATRNALVGQAARNAGEAYTTATVPSGAQVIGPMCSLGASLASTAVQPWAIRDEVAGRIVIGPGCTLSLQATAAAGSSPLVVFGATWEEVPA